MKPQFMIIFFLSSLAFAAPADKFIHVKGNCLREVMPDRGSIILTAEFIDMDAGSASKKAIEQYNKLNDAIKKLNLPDAKFETNEYSVNEEIEWTQNKRVLKGYRARMGLRVTTSQIAKLGDVIVVSTKIGVKDIGALMSVTSEKKMKEEREACLEEAFQNARLKADRLAKVAGVQINKVLSIAEEGAEIVVPPRPMMAHTMMAKGMAAPEMDAPHIQTQGRNIEVSVQAVFGY